MVETIRYHDAVMMQETRRCSHRVPPLIRHWSACSPHRTSAVEAHVKQLMGEGESATASSLVCVSHRRAAGNAASEIRRTTNLAFWHRDLSCRRCGERFPPPPATRVTNAMIAPRHLHTHPPSTPWPNLLSSVLVLVLIQYVLCRQAQKVLTPARLFPTDSVPRQRGLWSVCWVLCHT